MPTNDPGLVIITGSNGSLGLYLVRELLQKYPQHRALLLVRDSSDKDQNTRKLRSVVRKYTKIPNNIEIEGLDLGNLSSVANFAAKLKSRIDSGQLPLISAIICNAFTWNLSGQKFTTDGNESGFQVSHLAHFALVVHLLGQIDPSPGKGRIVLLGSVAHDGTKPNPLSPHKTEIPDNIEELVHPSVDEHGQEFPRGMTRYGIAKLCNVMLMHDLNRRLAQEPKLRNITVLAMDPGMLPASQAFNGTPVGMWIMTCVLSLMVHVLKYVTNAIGTLEDGAKDLLFLALSKDAAGAKGYYVHRKPSESSAPSQDQGAQEKLWNSCVRWSGINLNDTVLGKLS